MNFHVPSFLGLKLSLSYFIPHSVSLEGSLNIFVFLINKKIILTDSGIFRLIPIKSSSTTLKFAQFRHLTLAHNFPLYVSEISEVSV